MIVKDLPKFTHDEFSPDTSPLILPRKNSLLGGRGIFTWRRVKAFTQSKFLLQPATVEYI